MERWTQPVALITTFQPYLMAWLLAISFFLTMTFVAVISKGRNWKELLAAFVVGYFVLIVASIISTNFVADIQVVAFEVVSTVP